MKGLINGFSSTSWAASIFAVAARFVRVFVERGRAVRFFPRAAVARLATLRRVVDFRPRAVRPRARDAAAPRLVRDLVELDFLPARDFVFRLFAMAYPLLSIDGRSLAGTYRIKIDEIIIGCGKCQGTIRRDRR